MVVDTLPAVDRVRARPYHRAPQHQACSCPPPGTKQPCPPQLPCSSKGQAVRDLSRRPLRGPATPHLLSTTSASAKVRGYSDHGHSPSQRASRRRSDPGPGQLPGCTCPATAPHTRVSTHLTPHRAATRCRGPPNCQSRLCPPAAPSPYPAATRRGHGPSAGPDLADLPPSRSRILRAIEPPGFLGAPASVSGFGLISAVARNRQAQFCSRSHVSPRRHRAAGRAAVRPESIPESDTSFRNSVLPADLLQ